MRELIRNERLKLYRKTGTKVLCIVMVVLMILGSLLFMISEKIRLSSAEDDNTAGVLFEELSWGVGVDTAAGMADVSVTVLPLMTLFVVIIAAGMMSSEFSSGAIKLLVITPHRRSKIYWSKAVVLLELIGLLGGAVFVTSLLMGILFCGGQGLFVMGERTLADGSVLQIPFLLIVLARYVLSMLGTVMFASLAYMLGTVFRRSPGAIVIPLALMYVGTVVQSLLALMNLPGTEWMLISYLSPAGVLPGADSVYSIMGGLSGILSGELGAGGPTVWGAVIVLLFHIGCFAWIGRDNFSHRDI